MEGQDPERLKSFLKLISRKHGLEKTLEAAATAAAPAGGGLESLESPAAAAAQSGIESVLRDRDVAPDEQAGMEALIIPKLRPAIDVIDGKFNVTHELWTHLSSNNAVRQRIEGIIPSVGRIELPGNQRYPYGGTGFIVGNNLIMTNRHVAAIFANGLG